MFGKCIDKGAFVEVFQAISKVGSDQFALPNERKYGCSRQFFEKIYVRKMYRQRSICRSLFSDFEN